MDTLLVSLEIDALQVEFPSSPTICVAALSQCVMKKCLVLFLRVMADSGCREQERVISRWLELTGDNVRGLKSRKEPIHSPVLVYMSKCDL